MTNELFSQYQQRYQQLCAMRNAGQLTPQQFTAELQKLRWQDSRKVWWMINPEGVFMRFDGRRWVPVQPSPAPSIPPQAAAQAVPPAQPSAQSQPPQAFTPPTQPLPKSQGTKSGLTTMLSATPLLAILPSLLCGALWFLYTLIGVFKYEGIRGIDCVTPLIMVGLPLLFWVLKKPLDKLLLPLKPILQAFPKPLRYGIAIAVPVFLACSCSMVSTGGYLALNVATFMSIVVAAVLLRF